MQFSLPSALVFLCLCFAGQPTALAQDWKEIGRNGDLTVFTRDHPGSSIKEVRAIGQIAAPNWVVKNVLDDAEHYAQFMPYMAESRVLTRDPAKRTLVAYARLTPPLVSPRDYTILVHDEPRRAADGSTTYQSRWELANALGPQEKSGTVRVKINEGSWLLESTGGGKTTRACYTLFTDGGGGMPAFIINKANKTSINDLFEAIRKAARDEKYWQNRPAGP